MDFSGDGLINFAITDSVEGSFVDRDGNTIENGAFNSGTIHADGGKVLLTAHTAQKMVRSVVNNTGIIRAQSVSKRNGAIYLEAGPNGTATNEGTIDASGTDSGETGGTVHILGNKVGQLGTAMVDVSGDQGGGEVLIGGDYQGKGSVQNASITVGGSDTVVKANAITNGDGGRVIYWADDTTRFFGAIQAKGGANSGNGGFVEVSGKRFLDFNGDVITTAANGQTGTLLLDPDNLIIADGTAAANDSDVTDGTILFTDDDGDGSLTISEQTLEGLSSSTNISLQANNTITINDLSDDLLDLQQTNGHSVLLQTTSGNITFNDTFDEIRTRGGAITFKAGGSLTLGKLNSQGGNIDLTGVGVNIGGNIATGGGTFSADAGTGNYNQNSNVVVATAGGNATLTADGFNLLFGFVGSDGNIFGIPNSIVTDTFSFVNGPSSGTITLSPKTAGKSICIAATGCNIVLNRTEIISLKGKTLNVGSSNSGSITFGDLDLGHKKTNFVSGGDIIGTGANIVFHDDFSLAAKGNIGFTANASIEAHVSGFNKTFTAVADSDQKNGGGFALSSNSFIKTQGGNVNITGNAISPAGNNPDNIITNGGNYNRTIRSTSSTGSSILSSLPSSVVAFIQEKIAEANTLFIPTLDGPDFTLPKNQPLLDLFDDPVKAAQNRDQGNQASVLGDFLDNGGFKSGC